MYPTWVFGLPSGHEQGQYLTIDLGGTNLRVCWITLKGQRHETEIEQDTYKLPDHIKTGNAEELWDLIAECLDEFMQKHQLKGTEDEPYVCFGSSKENLDVLLTLRTQDSPWASPSLTLLSKIQSTVEVSSHGPKVSISRAWRARMS